MKRHKECICIGSLVIFFAVFHFYTNINRITILFIDSIYNVYWYSNVNQDLIKNYFDVSSCNPGLAYHLRNRDTTSKNSIKLVDLNPNKHLCRFDLSDDQIIEQCMNHTMNYNELKLLRYDNSPVLSISPPLMVLEMDNRDEILQEKYSRRVLEENGCLLPKGMWGNPFNSRCTIVTIAKIGNYKPNDLILDWGSGCGHQATWMTRFLIG